jgi:2-methylfumaryl-CoA hydratase
VKTNSGNFFEDFRLGQKLVHATPRTLTVGDQALYTALYGSRFALQSADTFAKSLGYQRAPLDDLLVFHIVRCPTSRSTRWPISVMRKGDS